MNFERGKNPKESLQIGLGSEAAIVRLINDAIKGCEELRDFEYDHTRDEGDNSWMKRGGGQYFTLYRLEPDIYTEGPEVFRPYIIAFDFGGFEYGNYSICNFFKKFGIKL